MKAEGSVSADANGLVGITGLGSAHLREQNYAGATSGTEILGLTGFDGQVGCVDYAA
jgi:hypothetical protein